MQAFVSVEEALRGLEHLKAHLSEGQLKTAAYRALNHTAKKGVTAARREIQKTFNAPTQALNNNLSMVHAYKNNLQAQIVAKGRPIPIKYFGASQQLARFDRKQNRLDAYNGKTTFNRKGVSRTRLQDVKTKRSGWAALTFQIYKGKTERLPSAFIQSARGRVSVFARGKYAAPGQGFSWQERRNPINELTGISVPLMFSRERVQAPFMQVVKTELHDRLEHEMKAVIDKIVNA